MDKKDKKECILNDEFNEICMHNFKIKECYLGCGIRYIERLRFKLQQSNPQDPIQELVELWEEYTKQHNNKFDKLNSALKSLSPRYLYVERNLIDFMDWLARKGRG